MTRRKFGGEFKIEAVKLVTERGVSVAQGARNLDLAEGVCGVGCGSWRWPRRRHFLATVAARRSGRDYGIEEGGRQVQGGA